MKEKNKFFKRLVIFVIAATMCLSALALLPSASAAAPVVGAYTPSPGAATTWQTYSDDGTYYGNGLLEVGNVIMGWNSIFPNSLWDLCSNTLLWSPNTATDLIINDVDPYPAQAGTVVTYIGGELQLDESLWGGTAGNKQMVDLDGATATILSVDLTQHTVIMDIVATGTFVSYPTYYVTFSATFTDSTADSMSGFSGTPSDVEITISLCPVPGTYSAGSGMVWQTYWNTGWVTQYGNGPLEVGNVIMGWNSIFPSSLWDLCPNTQLNSPNVATDLILISVNPNPPGSGVVDYDVTYAGGELKLDGSLWGGSGKYMVDLDGAIADATVDWTGGVPSSSCDPNGASCTMDFVATGAFVSYPDYFVTFSATLSSDYICSGGFSGTPSNVEITICPLEVWVDDDFTGSEDSTHFDTIQEGVDAVCDSGTVNVAAGTYPETVDIKGKELTIDGAGIGSTIIDASAFSGYAISNFGDYTTFKDVTLIGSSNYGFKVSHVSDITLENIRVEDSGRTGIDLHTVDTATLTNIEVVDTVGGFGIMILDSNDIDVTDIMTDNNYWGGVSVQTVNTVSDSISFSGTFDAREYAPLLLEKDPPTYYDITNVDIPDKFDYVVYDFRVNDYCMQWYYQETLSDAKTFANALLSSSYTYSGMLIYDILLEENYYVIPGMLIQDAVDDATGTTIHVDAGTYTEAITIDKELTLLGATSTVCKKDFTLPATLGDYDDTIQSVIKAPVSGNPNAVTITSSNVVLKGFVIEALDRTSSGGNNNNNLIELRPLGTEATMTGIVIENNVIGPNTDAASATPSMGRHGLRFTAGYGHTISADVTCNKIHGTYGNGNNVFIWGTAYGTTIPPAGPGPADLSGTNIHDNDICYSARSGVELSGAQFGATIDNNDIHDNGAGHIGDDTNLKWGTGIMLVRDYTTLNEGFVDSVTITDNEIYDNDKNGIYMGPMNKNHVITGNDIYDNGNPARGSGSTFGPGDGFRIDLEGSYYTNPQLGSTSNIVANCNNIEDNVGYGAQILGTPTNGFVLDATCNWWGDCSGPYHADSNPSGTGDAVSDYVDFGPWVGQVVADAGGPYTADYSSGYQVHFVGSGSSTSGCCGETITYSWDFDDSDGIQVDSTNMNPTHTYPAGNNTYNATLMVTGSAHGCTNTITTQVTVTSYPPVADAGGSYRIEEDEDDYTVQFDGSGSYDPDGSIVSYEWDFGDGDTGTGENPAHEYGNPDSYIVTLTVTDDDGFTDTDTASVYVAGDDPPIVQLTYPSGGEELSGTVTIKWFAIDSEDWDSPYIWLFYSPDGGDSWVEIARNLVNTIGEGAYKDRGEYSWNTGSLSDGNYILKIHAFDGAGNRATDISKPFTIGTRGTGLMVSYVTVGSSNAYIKDGDSLEIQAGITFGQHISADYVTADLSGLGKGTSVPADSFDGLTATWELTDVECTPSDGPITITITATDGGSTDSNTATIIADNTIPELNVITPENALYFQNKKLFSLDKPIIIGALTLEATADDSSGVQKTEIYIDDELKETLTGGSEWYMNLRLMGRHTLKIVAYDNAGNTNVYSQTMMVFNLFTTD